MTELQNDLLELLRKYDTITLNETEIGPNLSAYDLYENLCVITGSKEDIEPELKPAEQLGMLIIIDPHDNNHICSIRHLPNGTISLLNIHNTDQFATGQTVKEAIINYLDAHFDDDNELT